MKVILPQSAVDTLNKILNENKDKPSSIRVYFSGFGCSGASFGLALDEEGSSDVSINANGIHFIMDQVEYAQYGDVTIIDTGDGFRVVVENMPESMGCRGGCSGCDC